MTIRSFATAAATLGIALAAVTAPAGTLATEGQKLDSGLGELPHYSQWASKSSPAATNTRVPGESLDSGLGELPPYAVWVDKTGRDPLRRQGRQLVGLN